MNDDVSIAATNDDDEFQHVSSYVRANHRLPWRMFIWVIVKSCEGIVIRMGYSFVRTRCFRDDL